MGAKFLLVQALLNDMTDYDGSLSDDFELTTDVLDTCLEEARKSELQAETVVAILRAFGAAEARW